MYRMVIRELGGPQNLQREALTLGAPATGEVRIHVKAIGCNFFDILISKGAYQVRPSLPFAPGAEIAGIVDAIGDGVTDFQAGDRVSALLAYGGFTSHANVPLERVFAIPNEMDFDTAAALGLVYQTSHVALVHRARLQEGDTLLVHAAAGGVGLAAVQIGVALGASVIGTAGTDDKLKLIGEQGATAINYRTENWVDRVKELTDGRGADVIYDPVGGDTFDLSTKCIAFEGRLLVIGFASGRIPEAKMNHALVKNYSLVGLHWGLYFDKNPALLRQTQDELNALYAKGSIRPLVSKTYPLEDAVQALDDIASRRSVGKVVLHP